MFRIRKANKTIVCIGGAIVSMHCTIVERRGICCFRPCYVDCSATTRNNEQQLEEHEFKIMASSFSEASDILESIMEEYDLIVCGQCGEDKED
jgi:hypothetical protein